LSVLQIALAYLSGNKVIIVKAPKAEQPKKNHQEKQ
jgi:hypothetical protein